MDFFAKRKYADFAVAVVAIVAVGCYFLFFFTYAVNIPFLDDFNAVLNFLSRWYEAQGLVPKLLMLLEQHNEHRIVFVRLVAVADSALSGMVNFKTLMLVGNLSFFFLLVVLWRYFRSLALPSVYFLPVVLIIFQPNFYDNIFWGMAAAQNLCVVLFIFWSLYLLSQSGKGYVGAALFLAVLAVFTSASGLFVFAAGAVMLCGQGRRQACAAWIAVGLLAGATYFFHFQNPSQAFTARFFEPKFWALAVFSLPQFLGSFLAFVSPGASVGFRHMGYRTALYIGVSELVGTLMLAWSVIVAGLGIILALPQRLSLILGSRVQHLEQWFSQRRQQVSQSWFPATSLVAILITALSFAVNRSNIVVPNRYKMYSLLAAVFSYFLALIWLNSAWRRKVLLITLPLSVVFYMYSYFYNSYEIATHRRMLLASSYNWTSHQMGVISPLRSLPRAYEDIQMAEDRKLYAMPMDFAVKLNERLASSSIGSLPGLQSVVEGNEILISGTGPDMGNRPNNAVYVLLRSGSKTYVFATVQKASSLLKFLITGRLYASGFNTVYMSEFLPTNVPKSILPSGRYQVGQYVIDGSEEKVEFSNQFISF